MDAYGINVPKPQTNAHRSWAVKASFGFQVIAHSFRETLLAGQKWETKLPNGQNLGWITLEDDSRIEVGNKYHGKFATMNTFYTPAGEHFNYLCKSQQVTPAQWEQCVLGYLVEEVANDLCPQ